MRIIARCMIRNKPDSYCQAHDVETRGVSELVQDLIDLYAVYGVHSAARPANLARRNAGPARGTLARSIGRMGNRLKWIFLAMTSIFRRKK